MAYNYEYPYVDPHRYNDDWVLGKLKELEDKIKNLVPAEPTGEAPTLSRAFNIFLQDFSEKYPGHEADKEKYNDAKLKSMKHTDFYKLWDDIMFGNGLYMTKERLGHVDNSGDIYAYKWTLRADRYAQDEEDVEHQRVVNYQNTHEQLETIVIISGQHGDEKQNMIALALLFNAWTNPLHRLGAFLLNNYNFVIIPCANPYGIDNNIRHTAADADMNRSWITGYNVADQGRGVPYPTQPESVIIWDYLKKLKPYIHTGTEEEPEGYAKQANLKSTIVIDSHDYKYYWDTNYPVLVRTASNEPSIREKTLKQSTLLYDMGCEMYPEFRVNPTGVRTIRWNSNTLTGPRTLLNTLAHRGFKGLLIETPRCIKGEDIWYDGITFDLAMMNISAWISYAADEITEQNQLTRIRDISSLGFYTQVKDGVECGCVPVSLDDVLKQMPRGSFVFEYQYNASVLHDLLPASGIGFLEIYNDYGLGAYNRSLFRFTDYKTNMVYIAQATGDPGSVGPWICKDMRYDTIEQLGFATDSHPALVDIMNAMADHSVAMLDSATCGEGKRGDNDIIIIHKLTGNKIMLMAENSIGGYSAFSTYLSTYNIINGDQTNKWKKITLS